MSIWFNTTKFIQAKKNGFAWALIKSFPGHWEVNIIYKIKSDLVINHLLENSTRLWGIGTLFKWICLVGFDVLLLLWIFLTNGRISFRIIKLKHNKKRQPHVLLNCLNAEIYTDNFQWKKKNQDSNKTEISVHCRFMSSLDITCIMLKV